VQAVVARILDSSLESNSLEAFEAAATSPLGAGAGAGVAVSFGSVEAAAIEQTTEVARLARSAGALAVTTPSALWPAYERLWHRDAAATLLTVGSLPARLAETFEAVTRATAALGRGARVLAGGCAVVGSIRVLITGAQAHGVARFIVELRADVGAWDGTVMVQASPRDVRAAVDPWGPVPEDALALMRSIKATFDPDRRLNPGRFVGGL